MAKIYWRRIKARTRFFADVPTEKLQDEIRELAKADVESGEITAEQYKEFIGEEYPIAEETEAE